MKVLVAADLHLGYRMYGIKRREQDFYDSCANVFDIARKRNVNRVLLAGDVFDTARPPAAAVEALSNCARDVFNECGIETYAIEGNHDRVGTGAWLRVCGVTPLESADAPSDTAGLDYRRPKELMEALSSLADECEEKGRRIGVLVLHCGFEDMGDPFATDLPVSAVMPYLKRLGVHTVCVGHIHARATKKEEYEGHAVTFLQPGSIETCSLSEDRDKRVLVVEYDDGGLHDVYDVPLPTREFLESRIDNEKDLAEFIGSDAARFSGKMNIVRVRSDVSGAVQAVEEKLSNELFRVMTYTDKLEMHAVDRAQQLVSLESVIEEYFEPGTDVYEILRELFRNPDDVVGIAERYMKGEKDVPVSKLDS